MQQNVLCIPDCFEAQSTSVLHQLVLIETMDSQCAVILDSNVEGDTDTPAAAHPC